MTQRTPVTSIEYYLSHPDKLAALEPRLQKLFWNAREWHPVVRFNWVAGIFSNGLGKLMYPDGTVGFYQVPIRVSD